MKPQVLRAIAVSVGLFGLVTTGTFLAEAGTVAQMAVTPMVASSAKELCKTEIDMPQSKARLVSHNTRYVYALVPDVEKGSTCTYQWLRDGQEIPGATGSSYEILAADDGKVLMVRTTVTPPGGVPYLVTSDRRRMKYIGWSQMALSPSLVGDQLGDLLFVDWNGELGVNSWVKDRPVDQARYSVKKGFAGAMIYGPGDWNNDGHNDVISIDKSSGRMFLHPGLSPQRTDQGSKARLGSKAQIGQGWGGFQVIPAGDLDGDGFVDLLAIKQSTGELFLYAGDGKGGFKYPYRKVGYGWKGYDLYAAGDLNGDGNVDILSINSAGDLFMYAGKGDGTFAKRIQVGYGWKGYQLAAGADLTGDGLADIVSRDSRDMLYFYAGKGDGYFAKRVHVGTAF